MADDLAGAHPPRIHRDALVVETREAPLVFRDQLRIAARLAVPPDGQGQLPALGEHGLLAVAVARAAAFLTREMVIHLRVQHPLGRRLLPLIQPSIGIKHRLRIGSSRKPIQ